MSKKPFVVCSVAILFILCMMGCSGQDRQYGFTPVLENLTWGMSKEEVISNLSLTNSNTQVVEDQQSSAYLIIRLNEQMKRYEQLASVNLLITSDKESADSSCPADALSAIVYQYENADLPELRASMEKELGKASSDKTTDNIEVLVWKSKDKIADLPKSEREELIKYCSNYSNSGQALLPKNKSAMNKITLTITDSQNAVVTYYGDWCVYVNRLNHRTN